jgi:hypothetical protein
MILLYLHEDAWENTESGPLSLFKDPLSFKLQPKTKKGPEQSPILFNSTTHNAKHTHASQGENNNNVHTHTHKHIFKLLFLTVIWEECLFTKVKL